MGHSACSAWYHSTIYVCSPMVGKLPSRLSLVGGICWTCLASACWQVRHKCVTKILLMAVSILSSFCHMWVKFELSVQHILNWILKLHTMLKWSVEKFCWRKETTTFVGTPPFWVQGESLLCLGEHNFVSFPFLNLQRWKSACWFACYQLTILQLTNMHMLHSCY